MSKALRTVIGAGRKKKSPYLAITIMCAQSSLECGSEFMHINMQSNEHPLWPLDYCMNFEIRKCTSLGSELSPSV